MSPAACVDVGEERHDLGIVSPVVAPNTGQIRAESADGALQENLYLAIGSRAVPRRLGANECTIQERRDSDEVFGQLGSRTHVGEAAFSPERSDQAFGGPSAALAGEAVQLTVKVVCHNVRAQSAQG